MQFEESLRIRKQLYEANPNSAQAVRDVSVSLDRLGDFYLRRGASGDAERALAQFEESYRILKQLYEANPNSAQAVRAICRFHTLNYLKFINTLSKLKMHHNLWPRAFQSWITFIESDDPWIRPCETCTPSWLHSLEKLTVKKQTRATLPTITHHENLHQFFDRRPGHCRCVP